MIITSLENKEIKRITKLKSKKYRDELQEFIVEGEHLVEESYKNKVLKKIILLENTDIDIDVEKIYVNHDIMKKISNLDSPPKVIGICKLLEEKEIGDRVLILDGIQDPGNLGTIIRSAVAFNIDTIILSNDTVDMYNSKVIRSTQGMLFYINIIRTDLMEVLPELKKNNYTLYTTNVTNGTDIKNCEKHNKFALIVGNEGNGVSKKVSDYADYTIYIKTNNNVESLNVAVATSILLYELG